MTIFPRLSDLLRGRVGPLRFLARRSEDFEAASPTRRRRSLAWATAAMLVLSAVYVAQTLAPFLRQLADLRYEDQVHLVVNFQLVTLIGAACALLWLAAIFVPRPQIESRCKANSAAVPAVVFVVVAAFSALFFLTLPHRLFDRLFTFDVIYQSTAAPLFDSTGYGWGALAASLALALYFADAIAPRAPVRWWLIPFAIVPIPPLNVAPLLTWSFFASIFPSRYWLWWRPPLAALTCFLPLAAYAVGYPERPNEGTPVADDAAVEVLPMPGGAATYGIAQVPGRPEIYMGGGHSTKLAHLARLGGGEWQAVAAWEGDTRWNQAAYDFDAGRAYVPDVVHETMRVVAIPEMEPVAQWPLPPDELRLETLAPLIVHDEKARALIVASPFGYVYTVPTDGDGTPTAEARLPFVHQIAGMVLVDARRAVLLLFKDILFELDADTLQVRRRLRFSSHAAGMDVDAGRGLLYVALPREMRVARVSLDTFTQVGEIPAPAAVRVLRYVPSRDWLIAGALTGVVEIRDPASGQRIRRRRVATWIHDMAFLDDTGELALSFGYHQPRVWRLNETSSFDPFDTALKVGEAIARLLPRSQGRPDADPRANPRADPREFPAPPD
ncbi:MAG: hypothetical protein H6683_08945 [Deltaproteobacteria bacterium]|nr:hypothetical protein [Deltaproteobacteria bacterium]